MSLATVSLEDKYALDEGRIYVTGSQALTRLPLLQRQRDLAAGLNTGGFISGYRGSPLGGYDQALWKARSYLDENHISFQPGVNEDLAATAIWGAQQLGLATVPSRYDGVFGIWYGKGPGVDRSGDAFKHANLAGTSPNGGVIALAGDDHMAKSSTTAHQSEPALIAASIPVMNPANLQDYLDMGMAGFALSRYSGCWIGMKCVTDTIDGSASVSVSPERWRFVKPEDFIIPEVGVHIRFPDPFLEQEDRLVNVKLPAVQAFVRANRLDYISHDLPVGKRRLGLVASGKSWADLMHAFERLGLDERELREELGISVYKVAVTWPLEPQGIREFVKGQQQILVFEEKRGIIEDQLAKLLYRNAEKPILLGKQDEEGRPLVSATGELSADSIAEILARRLLTFNPPGPIAERLQHAIDAVQHAPQSTGMQRTPWFCSGCPHNTSTRVPDGSRAYAGIGCHYMAQMMDRNTAMFTHMGGEGAQWVGQAPFAADKHVFQNLGDGTYFHSGLLAIRAAVAANVNITYKLLYNDAVAMTGGQPVDGNLTPWDITQQLKGEGVRRIDVVTDEPDKYPSGTPWADGVKIHHRRELDRVQRELREVEGVTLLLYDQTCAAEKRRRRKRGTYPDPAKRVFINDAVCEGCGDCGKVSNCVAVKPLETQWGRKRQIDQSSCNKDYSCQEGFCPSFLTVEGGEVRKAEAPKTARPEAGPDAHDLPEPELPTIQGSYNILVTGIGGTGVVTIGALLGMAAHLEGKGISVLDQTGLAQKNGAVTSHIRLAPEPESLFCTRIGRGESDLVLGCDMVVAAGTAALATYSSARTHAVVNNAVVPIAAFALDPDLPMEERPLLDDITRAVGEEQVDFLPATRIATTLMGDAIYSNLFLVGYAWQKGRIPLSRDAIERAIELNGTAVEANRQAFDWGRRAAHAPKDVETAMGPQVPADEKAQAKEPETLDAVIAQREAHLTEYQNAAYAKRYTDLVRRVQQVEADTVPGEDALALAVARGYARLMAYKDEYEVARLYTRPAFRERLNTQFAGDFTLKVHLAPPLLAKKDPVTGHPRKKAYGPWVFSAFKVLSKLRFLRGTPLDPFGRTEERRTERQLIGDYETLVGELLDGLKPENHALAVELASIPDEIRGFGHIKAANLEQAKQHEARLLARFRGEPPVQPVVVRKAS